MLIYYFVLSVQVLLYFLLGSVLYFPGKLLETKINHLAHFANQIGRHSMIGPSQRALAPVAISTAPLTICTTIGCGVCESITDSGGIINSPNYPAQYGNNLTCIYNIKVPEGSKIRLTFTVFNVENNVDWIDVFYYNNQIIANSFTPSSTSLSGYSIPAPQTSTSNMMTVHFISNSDNSKLPIGLIGRWQATYTVI